MQPVAYLQLPEHVAERRSAFVEGFSRLGFVVRHEPPTEPVQSQDAVVTWNLMARSTQAVNNCFDGEGALIVAENGYYGKDANGFQPYALALDGHNGSGEWPTGGPERLEALNIPFKPMRPIGSKVLVADQRGIGSRYMRSPPSFGSDMTEALTRRGYTATLRGHPGRKPAERPLSEDLAAHDMVVVWNSNVATTALIEGLPTYYCAPHIVTGHAARGIHHLFPDLSEPPATEAERQQAFVSLSWAQWFLAEIASGEALKALLETHQQTRPRAPVRP